MSTRVKYCAGPLRLLAVWIILLGGVLPTLAAAGPLTLETRASAPDPTLPAAAVPKGVSSGEWASIQDQIRQAEYHLTWQTPDGADPAYRAPNRVQGLNLAFSPRGLTATDGAGTWQFSLRLAAYGDTPLPAAVARADLTAQQAAVTYRWTEAVSEWYTNRPEGVEHGLTLSAPPDGAGAGSGSQVQLTFALDTGLVPSLSADGQALTLRAPATGEWSVGPAVLRYAGLHVTDATGRTLPAHMEFPAPGKNGTGDVGFRISIDAAAAIYPLTVDPLLTSQAAKLLAADGAARDTFGGSVAVNGDIVVVGASDDDDLGDASGAAYVFYRNQDGADAWGQVIKLTAADGAAGDLFGCSVSVSGDIIVVGAMADDDLGDHSGSAYVFSRNQDGPDAWGQVIKLTAADGAMYDGFGWSVTADGETIVVGAPMSNDNGGYTGSAYVFSRNQGGPDAWGQVAKLLAADGTALDYFGESVALSGDIVVVGARGYYSDWGAAYVFYRDQGGTDAWGQVTKLTAADGQYGDQFGYAVALSGDTIVVGAPYDDDIDYDSGSAYVFTRNQGGADAWGQVKKLTADGAMTDNLGFAVAVSGDVVAVGVPADDDRGSNSGSVCVFFRNEGGIADSWGQAAKLTAADGQESDCLGWSVAMSGTVIVAGAIGDGDQGNRSGSAYVYYWASIARPDLVITKSVDPVAAAPGQAITYTLTFSNTGVDTAAGVVLTDTLPVSLTDTGVLSSGVAITRQAGTRYAWDVTDLPPGAGGVVTVTGVLSEPLAAGPLTNTATIAATTAEDITANNTTCAVLDVLNLAPAADDDGYSTGEDTALTVPAGTGLLDGDTDANGDSLAAVLDTDVPVGTLALHGDGSFVYIPAPDWSGLVTFTYRAHDGALASPAAMVTITVSEVNDVPAANDDAFTVDEDSSANVLDVLDNDSTAPDSGETLSIYAVGDPPHGTVGNQGTHLLYTPGAGFHGIDVFTYTVSDGNGGYGTATVTVTVQEAAWGVYLPLVLRNVVAGGDR